MLANPLGSVANRVAPRYDAGHAEAPARPGKREATMDWRRSLACFAASSAAAVAAYGAVWLARWPRDATSMSRWADVAIIGFLAYALVPATVLAVVALRRAPSPGRALVVCVGWLGALFALHAWLPMRHDGAFPWWMFERDFLAFLPVPLASALAASVATRAVSNRRVA